MIYKANSHRPDRRRPTQTITRLQYATSQTFYDQTNSNRGNTLNRQKPVKCLLLLVCICRRSVNWPQVLLTRPCTVPTVRQQAGQPDKAQTSGGFSPQRSSLSRGSGDRSAAHSADTSDSVWISWVAMSKCAFIFRMDTLL